MANEDRGNLRIGTSGYQYDHWRGVLYPEDLPKIHWLERYAEEFNTVEINNTFYGLPAPETFDNWREAVPEGFQYVLKFSRYGSHLKKLKDPDGTIRTFMERARRLKQKLGPVLVQLPPNWRANPERLQAFLRTAPSDQRWAVEFRDPSWLCEQVYDVLREHGAALCIHDMIPDHPQVVTAHWVYLRFHGEGDGGDYDQRTLAGAAERINTHLDENRDVYAYFNNDAHGYAVENAKALEQHVAG